MIKKSIFKMTLIPMRISKEEINNMTVTVISVKRYDMTKEG
jgi:hypothetical protein